MKQYRITITPNCESRFRAVAFLRWCICAVWVRLAFWALDGAFVFSDDCDIDVQREEVPE